MAVIVVAKYNGFKRIQYRYYSTKNIVTKVSSNPQSYHHHQYNSICSIYEELVILVTSRFK